jgi:hypothetical protein
MTLVCENLFFVCHNSLLENIIWGLLHIKSPQAELRFFEQIATDQFLQKLIPIQLTNHAACIVVIGDVGGILGEQITNDLVDGVVALFTQGVEHTPERAAHRVLIIAGYCKFNGAVVRHGVDLPPKNKVIIPYKVESVKSYSEIIS